MILNFDRRGAYSLAHWSFRPLGTRNDPEEPRLHGQKLGSNPRTLPNPFYSGNTKKMPKKDEFFLIGSTLFPFQVLKYFQGQT